MFTLSTLTLCCHSFIASASRDQYVLNISSMALLTLDSCIVICNAQHLLDIHRFHFRQTLRFGSFGCYWTHNCQ
jgi:hypothetical protein